MYSTPCSFRLFASRSAPLISAIDSLLSFELVSDPACRKSERPHITHLWPAGKRAFRQAALHGRLGPAIFPEIVQGHPMINARRKAVAEHRKRLKSRGLVRIELRAPEQDAAL